MARRGNRRLRILVPTEAANPVRNLRLHHPAPKRRSLPFRETLDGPRGRRFLTLDFRSRASRQFAVSHIMAASQFSANRLTAICSRLLTVPTGILRIAAIST